MDDYGVHREQSHARQHLIVSKSPFLCHCGQNFTRLCSLERHVQNNTGQLQPEYPCPECPAYQGKNGFKRKDHLVQHLRVLHNWDNNQLATLFPPRQTRKFNIPVCHFPECDYYRDPSFKDMGIREQEENRPFDKQSHYTDHMKREHDWSPYPCKVSGCSKVNGTGFFSTTTLEKHYKKKHPGSAIPAPKVQDPTTQTVRCDCGKSFKRSNIAYHQEYQCKSLAPCRYCHERIVASDMGDHCRNNCKGCLERMVYGQLWEHEANYCKGEAQCHKCSMRMERRLLGYRHFCILCRVRI
ncbi:hypothetical protein F4801DRAFT_353262 [Xylaria longipes]|nr:hypothetical protein F4801DRAFT_353262 [Xylaria longipes]